MLTIGKLAVLADVRDNLLDRLLVRFASPRGGHDTEITVVDATACGFKYIVGQIAMARQQVASGKRPVGQTEVWRLIVTRLKLAVVEVTQQLRP